MNQLNRRTVLLASMGGAIGALLPIRLLAQAPLVTRHAAQSAAGKEMLKIYAKAVTAMMDTSKYPEGDARSWTFQWYTHMVKGNTDKSAELDRIYGSAGAGRALAAAMWDTCEAHTNSARENFFLPWHRLYVQCFEQIIRHVSGRPDFALPYWDYTDPAQRALPKEFRSPNDPVFKDLYRNNRRGLVNQGQGIDSWPNAYPINDDALTSTLYAADAADAGFCANLDGNLHGNVHGDVGNGMGMGSVTWAANDPIFWLHHCNIDRLWASWNREGGKNPTDAPYLAETFTFADKVGNALLMKVADAMQMNGYVYDAYVQRPADSPAFPAAGPLMVARHGVSKRVTPSIALSSRKSVVRLMRPNAAPDGGPLLTTVPSINTVPPEARFYLKLENITTNVDPEIVFDVHISSKAGIAAKRGSPTYVGSISFFGVTPAHHHHGGAAGAAGGRNISFLLSKAQRRDITGTALPYITIVPAGRLPANAQPLIGNVALSSR
jgi:tyrosinase